MIFIKQYMKIPSQEKHLGQKESQAAIQLYLEASSSPEYIFFFFGEFDFFPREMMVLSKYTASFFISIL